MVPEGTSIRIVGANGKEYVPSMDESVSTVVRVMSLGGGFPSLVKTTTGRHLIMKLRGVGQGTPGLLTEFIALRLASALGLKVPHVGWNALDFRKPARLLAGLEPGAQVYFTHSFAAPVTNACAAATTHANTFASAVEDGNVFGVQFHPEKSSDAGLQIIRSFLELARRC